MRFSLQVQSRMVNSKSFVGKVEIQIKQYPVIQIVAKTWN